MTEQRMSRQYRSAFRKCFSRFIPWDQEGFGWRLGEILKRKEKVAELLDTDKDLELMAVVAFGHPAKKPGRGGRDFLQKKVFLRK